MVHNLLLVKILYKHKQRISNQVLGAYQPYLTTAAAAQQVLQAYQQFMSPYQQDVIDTTLQEYDIQAQKGLPVN